MPKASRTISRNNTKKTGLFTADEAVFRAKRRQWDIYSRRLNDCHPLRNLQARKPVRRKDYAQEQIFVGFLDISVVLLLSGSEGVADAPRDSAEAASSLTRRRKLWRQSAEVVRFR